jgi:hypothetical protein
MFRGYPNYKIVFDIQELCPVDGGNMLLRNFAEDMLDYASLHSHSHENLKSHIQDFG